MINLLSDVKKAEIRAARTNTILLRYIGVLTGALLFVGGLIYISYQSLKTSEESAQAQLSLIGTSTGLSPQNNTALLGEIASITQGTPKVGSVFTAIAQALPQGAILQSLALTPENLQSGAPFSLVVYTKKDTPNTSIGTSLQSSGVLQGVAQQSVATNNTDVAGYPVRIEFSTSLQRSTTATTEGILP